MHPRPRLRLAFALLPAIFGCSGASAGSREATRNLADPTIREWTVPWPDTRPRDPVPAPDGTVWFVGQTGDYVGRLDPVTGSFERFELEPGTGPHNLVVDGDGIVWFTGNRAAHLGRLDPATGRIERIPMPDAAARDPHTLVFDGRGRLWLTVQMGNFVGRFDPESRDVKLIAVPTPDARPYGIVADREGRAWFTEFAGGKIGTVDPATLELREVELRAGARPRRLTVGPDGAIWYGDFAGGRLGRLDPATSGVREWPMPAGEEARPYAVGLDDTGRIWLAETGPDPNRLVAFDPDREEFVADVPVPSGGGSIRHMAWDAARRVLWFGTDAGTIGRLDPNGGAE
jgi:virginiamycin B lyase